MSLISSQDELDVIIGIFMETFKEDDLDIQNPVIMSQLTNCLVAKQLILHRQHGSFSQTALVFFDFILRNSIVCSVYKTFVASALNKGDAKSNPSLADLIKEEQS